MAWRKPPKIAPRQLKRTAGDCPPDDGGRAAQAAAERASETTGGSRFDRLSKPKHAVEAKARRNPREIREAAQAKQMAKIRGEEAGANTPRVRTTVTKTKSRPDGGSETTTVEKVASGPAAPRYNKKKVMHPADEYKMSKRPIPQKPSRRCPRIKPKTVYPKEVRELWEDWQRYNEFQEEVKCWKLNQPYLTAAQKEERRFAKWMKKEEDTHEAMWKAGRTNIKPFHLRGAAPGSEKKKKPLLASASVKELPKTPTGKRRYMKKDCFDNYIRYNSVGDPHPEDVWTSTKGGCVPEYVQPPLKEDGTFKKPKERTEEETEALKAYLRWEEFYFKVQSWEADKKWVGDPRIEELWKIKSVSGTPGAAMGNTAEGRAAARAAERANKAALRSGAKQTRAAASAAAMLKKMGGRKLTGAAKVALQSLARKEAAAAAAEEAKANAIAERQRSFLKRGTRDTPRLGRGRIDVRNVQSRVGGLIRADKERARQRADELADMSAIQIGPPPGDPCTPPPAEPCSPPFVPPSAPPFEVCGAWERRIQDTGQTRRRRRELGQMARTIGDHMALSGNIAGVQLARKGRRPASGVKDSMILPYDPSQSVRENFGLPTRLTSFAEEGEMQGCDPMPQDWNEPDLPLTPLAKRALRRRGLHPSPPKSISKGRLPHQPMHPIERMYEQFRTAGDDYWLAEQELEEPEERAYADRCMEYQINKPLRERLQQMAAATDRNLLHPAIFRSDLRQRMRDTGARKQQLRNLSAVSQMLQSGDLPDIQRLPVSRIHGIPSPPCSPEVPIGSLLDIEGPPCASPPTPPLPPPAFSPSPCRPPPVSSPYEIPARFIPEMNNPYLQVAQRAIESLPSNIPYRGEEIADTYARVQQAARGPAPTDLLTPWEMDDMCEDIVDFDDVDNALERLELTPPGAGGAAGQWQFPEYHQYEGPQAGALYHEHSRRPQLGPWHYTPPGGRQRHHAWQEADGIGPLVDIPPAQGYLVDIPQSLPTGPVSRYCI
uniref:Uncharacterized protein n=1 Tax=Lygus hesperus TaxID=30085 RepID=A0A0A9Z2F4_LYGHE